jgi:hypothetical protein
MGLSKKENIDFGNLDRLHKWTFLGSPYIIVYLEAMVYFSATLMYMHCGSNIVIFTYVCTVCTYLSQTYYLHATNWF